MERAKQPLCAAQTRAGRPCRNRAIRGLDFCLAHAPREGDQWNPPRPCSATTRRGRPCKAPAIKESDPPLCCAHAGRARPLWPPRQRCTAQVRNPRRLGHKICRGRAVPGTDPPRCPAHAGLTTITRDVAIQCSATNNAGRPCGMPAAAGSDPPLCAVHAGRNGFAFEHTRTRMVSGRYLVVPRRRFWQQWGLAYLALYSDAQTELTLQQQLTLCRLAVNCFIELARESAGSDPIEFARHVRCVDIGLRLIADLLQDSTPSKSSQEALDTAQGVPATHPESPSEFRPLLYHP